MGEVPLKNNDNRKPVFNSIHSNIKIIVGRSSTQCNYKNRNCGVNYMLRLPNNNRAPEGREKFSGAFFVIF